MIYFDKLFNVKEKNMAISCLTNIVELIKEKEVLKDFKVTKHEVGPSKLGENDSCSKIVIEICYR